MLKKLMLLPLLAVVLLAGCTRVGPGHVGIKVNMAGDDKGVLSTPVSTGWVFYNPGSTSVIEYPTNMKTVVWTKSADEGKPTDESITFTNKESMTINADFSINYYLKADQAPAFYVKFLAKDIDDFSDGYLRSVARNCVNDNAGGYEIEKIMGDNTEFLNKSKACINGIVGPYGVVVDQFGFIGAPRPPQAVIDNINEKIQAQQIAMRKQNELVQVQADAAKQVAAAEGHAKSQIAEANGEAEANRIRTASITPVILQNKALDNQHDMIWRWNGQSPSTVIGGEGKNVILQLPELNK
jgi:regulator of protease activity HflC (stomatin/prohibitin superfamily)